MENKLTKKQVKMALGGCAVFFLLFLGAVYTVWDKSRTNEVEEKLLNDRITLKYTSKGLSWDGSANRKVRFEYNGHKETLELPVDLNGQMNSIDIYYYHSLKNDGPYLKLVENGGEKEFAIDLEKEKIYQVYRYNRDGKTVYYELRNPEDAGFYSPLTDETADTLAHGWDDASEKSFAILEGEYIGRIYEDRDNNLLFEVSD